jgi:DtxR family Mn-dependent transcriptional regulator
MEDYLKGAFLLRERGQEITVLALAEALDVSAPSVTGMVKRLVAMGLMQHAPYRSIALTPAGESVALEVVRHHRLLELYLAEFLGVPWDKVHAEADALEHHLSEYLEDCIAERLGQPATDPHGDPIPSRDLTLPELDLVSLASLAVGDRAVVARISDQEPGLLHYLGTLGLVPGTPVTLVGVAPYGGVVTVGVGPDQGATHTIAREVAAMVLVKPVVADVRVPR